MGKGEEQVRAGHHTGGRCLAASATTPENPSQVHIMGLLLAASDYDKGAMHYLVEGCREGFHLRLDRPVDQIASDRKSNKRVVKGNNKTALDNPESVEAKLEKELLAKRMIGPFLGPVFPAYVISPLGLRKKKVHS